MYPKRLKILLVSLLFFHFQSFSASAFVILPPECRPTGDKCLFESKMKYIFIFGHITYEESNFFKKLDWLWKKDIPLPTIYVESSGGFASTSLYVGQMLHERKGIVVSGNPITKTDGYECASACAIIAAGATERHLTHIGIHQASKTENACKQDERRIPVEQFYYQKILDHLDYFEAGKQFREYYEMTRFDEMTDLYYWDELKPEEQMIVEMGYHMDIRDNATFEIFKKGSEFKKMKIKDQFAFAIKEGSKDAIYDAIQYYTCQPEQTKIDYKALNELLELAAKTDPDAAFEQAHLFEESRLQGKSIADAIIIYVKLAEQKHSASLQKLGLLNYEGRNIPRNYRRAVKLFEQAAEMWEPDAFGSLCRVYIEHKAVSQNDITSYKWCDLAIKKLPANSEKEFAIESIHKLANRMNDRQIDIATKSEASYFFPEIQTAVHEYVFN